MNKHSSLFNAETQEYVFNQLNKREVVNAPEPMGKGRSGSQVFRFQITSDDVHNAGWHVAKLSDNNDSEARYATTEGVSCQTLYDNADEKFKLHLLQSKVYPHKNLQIIVSRYAGLSRENSIVLCDLPKNQVASYVEDIFYDLLSIWNYRIDYRSDVESFFSTLLGERIKQKGGKFAEKLSELLENPLHQLIDFQHFKGKSYPNPYYYISNIQVLIDVINNSGQRAFIKGKTHGDLHTENIICDKRYNKSAYVIIDYSHYNSQSFILYDHAFLEADYYYQVLKDKEHWYGWHNCPICYNQLT